MDHRSPRAHTARFCLFLNFNYLVSVTAGESKSPPKAHIAKFYGRLRLIRSVLRASKFSVLKLIEIIILWVYYTISFGFSLFRHFWASLFNLSNYFVWIRITDEGSVPQMRIWSIFLIKSALKWCIHLSRSLFFYFNYLVSVTAGGPVSPRGHTQPSSTVDFGWFVAFREHQIFLKFIEIVILWVYYTIPVGFTLIISDLIWCIHLGRSHFYNSIVIIWLKITNEGSISEMCLWSILLTKMLYPSKQTPLSITATWWETLLVDHWFQTTHAAKFCGGLRWDRSIFRASKFSVFSFRQSLLVYHYRPQSTIKSLHNPTNFFPELKIFATLHKICFYF